MRPALACPAPVSSMITRSLVPNVVSSVVIAPSANNICHDSVVTFTASPSNGGDNPTYQWQIGGRKVGTDSSVYYSGNLDEGDLVSVVMSSDLLCSSPVVSNAISMTVYDVPHIQLTPDTIIAAGSHFTLDPVVTGPADN